MQEQKRSNWKEHYHVIDTCSNDDTTVVKPKPMTEGNRIGLSRETQVTQWTKQNS